MACKSLLRLLVFFNAPEEEEREEEEEIFDGLKGVRYVPGKGFVCDSLYLLAPFSLLRGKCAME